MGGSTQSKLEKQLAVPAPTQPLPTRDEILNQPNVGENLNVSLHDTERLLDDDSFWLDQGEMNDQEDEDAKLAKECHDTGVSLQTWVDSQPMWKEAKIPSHEPVSKYLGAAKSTEYTLVTHAGTVKRRYRDFVALKNGLEIRFPGSCIPPIPPSRSLGKTDPEFVQQRCYMLEQFLRCVLVNPFWSRDDLFQTFIESKNTFNRKECLLSRGQLIRDDRLSVASKRWSQALMDTVPIPNPIFVSKRATQELEKVREYLTIMRDLHGPHRKRVGVVVQSWADFAQAFRFSQQEESRLVVFHAGRELPDTLFQLANTYENYSTTLSASLKDEVPTLVVPLLYELLYVESYLERLKGAVNSIATLRKLTTAYKAQKESPENASFTTKAIAAVPMADDHSPNDYAAKETANKLKLAKLRLNAVYAQMKARRDICGVLFLELNHYTAQRSVRSRKMVAQVGLLHLERAKAEQALWSKFVQSHGGEVAVSSHTMLAETAATGSGMVLPPPPPPSELQQAVPAAAAAAAAEILPPNPFRPEEEEP